MYHEDFFFSPDTTPVFVLNVNEIFRKYKTCSLRNDLVLHHELCGEFYRNKNSCEGRLAGSVGGAHDS